MSAPVPLETPIVDAQWLLDRSEATDLRIVDATWIPPFLNTGKTGHDLFNAGRIPGAVFFDIDDIADPDAGDLPHMAPAPAMFATKAGALGLGNDRQIICYDQNGLMASARAWWLLRLMGHRHVFVLDGGLAAWREAGGDLETGPARSPETARFTPEPETALLADMTRVSKAIASADAAIVDARHAGRFSGAAPEPRPQLKSGHMPGAFNLPHSAILDATGRLRAPDDIRTAFRAAGVDLDRPLITTCGSGVTAAILSLGLAHAGRWDAAVYDGSWSEWAATEGCAIATLSGDAS